MGGKFIQCLPFIRNVMRVRGETFDMEKSGNSSGRERRIFVSLIRLSGLRSADVPDAIADQLLLFQYQQIHRQIPTLYAAVISIIIGAGIAMTEAFPLIYRVALPVVLVALCLFRLRIWTRRQVSSVTVDAAARHLKALFHFAVSICLVTSIWNLAIYFGTQAPYRGSVPMFIVIAAICTACGLASLPRAAIMVLIITISPISFAMLFSNDQVLITMAVGLIILIILQSRLIVGQFAQSLNAILLQDRMRVLADTDSLTGLANRRAFLAAVEEEISNQNRACAVTVAMIDLDDFKPINDRYGHHAGDEVLRITASRLQILCSPYGFAARLGGDEFALLLNKPMTAAALDGLANDILAETQKRCNFDGQSTKVTACVGWAQWPRDGETAEEVIRAADRALYEAKYSGRSKIAQFASLAQQGSMPRPKRLRAA